jgi:hypothetical protein
MAPKLGAVLLGLLGLFLAVLLIGQGTGMSQPKGPTLKMIAIAYSQPESGKQMFNDYCAACHGMEGKGTGPAVQFLRVPPPDLTTMDLRYSKQSVGLKVSSLLRFGTTNSAHGTLDMPLWGRLFNSLNGGSQVVVDLRVRNLSDYVDSIQKK